MKLRLLPMLISLVVSSGVLFGGWFIYHSVAMENPLNQIVSQLHNTQDVQTKITNDQVTVSLKLKPGADLREIYRQFVTDGSKIIGQRKVNFNITNASSPSLDAWWSNALFDVAQAMETRTYSQIPKSLNALAADYPGLKISCEMDDSNVYIHLNDGKNDKYIILPRNPLMMGVYANE